MNTPRATLNICTNKLKFFPPPGRLTPDQDKDRKSIGFAWWPGQKCFAAAWSPRGEDWIRSFGIEIEDDDRPDDVEARVNRFEKYAENDERAAEAARERITTANTARRLRMATGTAEAKAEEAAYWNDRIASAIRHAEHKDSPETIANRIKGLEADRRKHERTIGESETTRRFASFVHEWRSAHGCGYVVESVNGTISGRWIRPMTDEEKETARADFEKHDQHIREYAQRWIAYLDRRLQYEKSFLDAQGGSDLIAPKPRAKANRRTAPEDGIKKGSRVLVKMPPYYTREEPGEVVSLGAANVKVKMPERGKDWIYEYPRRLCRLAPES